MSYEIELQKQILDLKNRVDRSSAVEKATRFSSLTLANDTLGNPFGVVALSGGFAGVLIVNETSVEGHIAAFMTGGGSITTVSSIGTWSTTAGNAGTHNVYLDANLNVVIQNKRGGSRSYNVLGLITRSVN
jgi:hypothetical protein